MEEKLTDIKVALLIILLFLNSVNVILHTFGALLLIEVHKNVRQTTEQIYVINIAVCAALMNLLEGVRQLTELIPLNSSVKATMEGIHIYTLIVMFTGISFVYYFDMIFLTFDRLMVILLNIRYPLYWDETKATWLLRLTWVIGISLSVVISLLTCCADYTWQGPFFKYFYPSLEFGYIILAVVTYGFIFHEYKRTRRSPSQNKCHKVLPSHNGWKTQLCSQNTLDTHSPSQDEHDKPLRNGFHGQSRSHNSRSTYMLDNNLPPKKEKENERDEREHENENEIENKNENENENENKNKNDNENENKSENGNENENENENRNGSENEKEDENENENENENEIENKNENKNESENENENGFHVRGFHVQLPMQNRSSEPQKQQSAFQVFRKSRFSIPVLLTLSFLVFMVLPDLLYLFVAIVDGNDTDILSIICWISYALANLSDAWIYIFMQQPVKRLLFKKLKLNRRANVIVPHVTVTSRN